MREGAFGIICSVRLWSVYHKTKQGCEEWKLIWVSAALRPVFPSSRPVSGSILAWIVMWSDPRVIQDDTVHCCQSEQGRMSDVACPRDLSEADRSVFAGGETRATGKSRAEPDGIPAAAPVSSGTGYADSEAVPAVLTLLQWYRYQWGGCSDRGASARSARKGQLARNP